MSPLIDQNRFNLDCLPSVTSSRFYIVVIVAFFNAYYIGALLEEKINQFLTTFESGSQFFPPFLFMPTLVFCASLVIFLIMPKIIIHRGNLSLVDNQKFSEMLIRIENLANKMQVPCPLVYFSPSISRQNAQVFGSEKNPKLRIDKGVMLLYARRPDLFDAIILHELAHILHRDVFKAYAARAIVWATSLLSITVVLVRGNDFIQSLLGHTYEWINHVSFYDEITWFLVNFGIFLQNIAIFIPLFCLLFIEYAKLIRIREHFADWRASQHGAREALLSIFQKNTSNQSTLRNRFFSTHPLLTDRAQFLIEPLKMGSNISIFDALILGMLMVIFINSFMELLSPIKSALELRESYIHINQVQSPVQLKASLDDLFINNSILSSVILLLGILIFINISAYPLSQIAIIYCLGGWLNGRSVIRQIISAFKFSLYNFIGAALGYFSSPSIIEDLPNTLEPTASRMFTVGLVPMYFLSIFIYFSIMTRIIGRWMQGDHKPWGITITLIFATNYILNISCLLPAIGFFGRNMGIKYSFAYGFMISTLYFLAFIILSLVLARVWLHKYRKRGNLNDIPLWMCVKSSLLQTQGVLAMKISSVEQFKAEIMYNKEFQERLREDPVKAVEKIDVCSSHVNEERKFSLVLGGVANTILLVGLIGISILAASRASTSDIENLQSQIDNLQISVAQVSADKDNTLSASASASSQAASAQAAANRAAQYAQDTNNKIDTLLKRSILR